MTPQFAASGQTPQPGEPGYYRPQFPGSVREALRDGLLKDLQSALRTIDTLLDHQMNRGVLRNLQAAQREVNNAISSSAAAFVCADKEAGK